MATTTTVGVSFKVDRVTRTVRFEEELDSPKIGTLYVPKATPSKRPRDPNALAKRIVDEATGDAPPFNPDAGKDAAAVALGRKGGLKGGKARAENMTREERVEAARRAAMARWHPSS